MLIGIAVCQDAYGLRVPISDTKRKREVLEEASKLEYARALRDLLHDLSGCIGVISSSMEILFFEVDYSREREILKKLGKISRKICDNVIKG